MAEFSEKILIVTSLVLLIATSSIGLDNGLVRLPPMGWMSWARYTCQIDCSRYPDECISEKLFKDMADHLVSDGYRDVGYEYVNIDDCWSELERDPETNQLVANKTRFPSGIKKLSQYMQSKQLKLGNLILMDKEHATHSLT